MEVFQSSVFDGRLRMSAEIDEFQGLLEGLLDKDTAFSFDELCNGHDTMTTSSNELLEEVVSGAEEKEFSWGPSILSPPEWNPFEEDGDEVMAPDMDVDNQDLHPTSEKSCASIEVPVLDSASSTGEIAPLNAFLIPATDFLFQASKGAPVFSPLGRREIITTGMPGFPSVPTGIDINNSTFPPPGPGVILPLGCSSGVILEGQTSTGSGTNQGSSGTTTKATKRPRRDEKDWQSIKDPEERKKQKRMAKNRHTAAMSRERRRQYLQDLEHRVKSLEQENVSLRYWLGAVQHENFSLKTGADSSSLDTLHNPTPESALALTSNGEAQEPAVLPISTLLATMQLVVSPMILPLMGLLVVLIGTANSMEDHESKLPKSGSTLITVLFAIMCVLWLPSSLSTRKDDKSEHKGIGALESPPRLSRIKEEGISKKGVLWDAATACSSNLDKLSAEHVCHT